MAAAKNIVCIRCFKVFCAAVCGLRPVLRASPLSMRATLNIFSSARPGNRQCDTCSKPEDFDRAAEIIAEHGSTWIASGKLGSLAALSEASAFGSS